MPQREAVRPGTVVLRSRCCARKQSNVIESSNQVFPFPKHLQVVIAGRHVCATSICRPRENKSSAPPSHCACQSPRLPPSPPASEGDSEFSASRPSTGRPAGNGCGRWRGGRVGGRRWGNDEYSSLGPERTERRKRAVNERRRTKERP